MNLYSERPQSCSATSIFWARTQIFNRRHFQRLKCLINFTKKKNHSYREPKSSLNRWSTVGRILKLMGVMFVWKPIHTYQQNENVSYCTGDLGYMPKLYRTRLRSLYQQICVEIWSPCKRRPIHSCKKNLGMNECSKERPSGIPNELNKDLADILTRLLQQNDRSYGFS